MHSCAKTTEFFEKLLKSKRYAGVKDAIRIEYSKPIDAYRKEYLRGIKGHRDGKRAAVFMEALKLKNAAHNVLRFHLALGQMGFDTTLLPEDIAASLVSDSCGCKCSPRTYRRAKNEVLVPLGWLHSEAIPTGNKVATKYNQHGEPIEWKMKQVCMVKITPAAKLLIAKASPVVEKQPLESELLPRPKEPIAITKKQGYSYKNSPCNNLNLKKQKTSHARQRERLDNEVGKTRVPMAPVEQRPIKPEPRLAPRKPAKNDVFRFGRRSRNKIRKTWASNRESFLSDLFRATQDTEICRIAALQTDLAYPPLLPVAIEYEPFVFCWHEYNWQESRRILQREIIPAIRAFAVNLVSAPLNQKQNEGFRALQRAFTGMSHDLIIDGMPEFLVDTVRKNRFMIDRVPWLLTLGKMKLNDIREHEKEIFRNVADNLGQD